MAGHGLGRVRILVADDQPGRGTSIVRTLASLHPEEIRFHPGALPASAIPAAQPGALLVLGLDDPALVSHLSISCWLGADRAVIVHGNGLSDWPVSSKARLLLATRAILLDNHVTGFLDALTQAVLEVGVRLAQESSLDQEARAVLAAAGLIGESPPMIALGRQIAQATALASAPVMILGETGTGKELVARALHRLGTRRTGPFVAANCAALTATLAESELFGHRRGAYTGAESARAGLIRTAHGGVLFLDEIGELPLAIQGKLLRVLQEQRVQPVGEDRELSVNVRPIAATNRDLGQMVLDAGFRRDLYHRLAAFTIRVPPLRERTEDLPLLVRHFTAAFGEGPLELETDAAVALQQLRWPGNVRELEQVVLRTVALRPGNRPLKLEELPAEVLEQVGTGHASDRIASDAEALRGDLAQLARTVCAGQRNLEEALAICEREIIAQVLSHTGRNQTRAARCLGVSPRAVYDKLRRLRIPT